MRLIAYTDEDLPLTRRIECDPAMMAQLGGPIAPERIPEIHRKRMTHIAVGAWWFKIVPEGSGEPAGTVGIWEQDWNGAKISEMGWMVLPAFQGRGLATAAASALIERAGREGKFGVIHAFPGIANPASNAICRKLGFVKLEEVSLEYAGRPIRCVHWRSAKNEEAAEGRGVQ